MIPCKVVPKEPWSPRVAKELQSFGVIGEARHSIGGSGPELEGLCSGSRV